LLAGARSVAAGDGTSIHYDWRMARDPETGNTQWAGRYQLRGADGVLAGEAEEIVLRFRGVRDVVEELHRAGFTGARVTPVTGGMSWLADAGCILVECVVPGHAADA
jgi:hypothetical protein